MISVGRAERVIPFEDGIEIGAYATEDRARQAVARAFYPATDGDLPQAVRLGRWVAYRRPVTPWSVAHRRRAKAAAFRLESLA